MVSIYCVGDSITQGYNDSQGGWVNRLNLHLEKKYPGRHRVINLGISGDDSVRILSRIDGELSRFRAAGKRSLMLLSCLINDSLRIIPEGRHQVPLNDYTDNIKKIITIAKKYDIAPVILDGLPVVDAKTDPIPSDSGFAYRNKYIRQYRDALKKLCRQESVHFIDVFDNLLNNGDYMHSLNDGVHPGDRGHDILFDTIRNYLEENKLLQV
jgi:lysophospholipase L1-like esterase